MQRNMHRRNVLLSGVPSAVSSSSGTPSMTDTFMPTSNYETTTLIEKLLNFKFPNDNRMFTYKEFNRATFATTLKIYLPVFVVTVFIFCCVRDRFPITFFPRVNIKRFSTDYVKEKKAEFNRFNWLWKIMPFGWLWKFMHFGFDKAGKYDDDDADIYEICDFAGYDAAIYAWAVRYMAKVAFVGVLNSIYLLPLYYYASQESEVEKVDTLYKFTMGNIQINDGPRYKNVPVFASVFASYVLFGFAMKELAKGFKWYIKLRHRFLTSRVPQNYTVFIRNFPDDLETDGCLLNYFQLLFSEEDVFDATVVRNIPKLEASVSKQKKIVRELEHQIALKTLKKSGVPFRDRLFGDASYSIDQNLIRLSETNENVRVAINEIEMMKKETMKKQDGSAMVMSQSFRSCNNFNNSLSDLLSCDFSADSSDSADTGNYEMNTFHRIEKSQGSTCDGRTQSPLSNGTSIEEAVPSAAGMDGSALVMCQSYRSCSEVDADNFLSGDEADLNSSADTDKGNTKPTTFCPMEISQGETRDQPLSSGTNIEEAIPTAADIVSPVAGSSAPPGREGSIRNAAFVSFSNLQTTMTVLQCIHDRSPTGMDGSRAPHPDDILWPNIGISDKSKFVGWVASQILTAFLFLLWTFPTAAIQTLNKSETIINFLKGDSQRRDDLLAPDSFIYTIVEQIAPCVLIFMLVILRVLIALIVKLEGHTTLTSNRVSTFTKLTFFTIFQTFFISLISGATIEVLLGKFNLLEIVRILGKTLPNQSTFFMQFVTIKICLGIPLELFRIVRLLEALLLYVIGPKLTPKERASEYLFLRPVLFPRYFYFPLWLSELVFYLAILFVYSIVAPWMAYQNLLVCWILSFSFRNQFLFVYPPHDSGGKYFHILVNYINVCMVIAQIALIGIMLLNQAYHPVIAMVPLLAYTVLFWLYSERRHFLVAKFLPLNDCKEIDIERRDEDCTFLFEKYKQPALKVKSAKPDNITEFRSFRDRWNIEESIEVNC
mmetsp:Transcript_32640/g.64700  ORF Transcript_32640/g.64700 Transcript_32640/m.64700 type:complete len:996 (+) Transcript_32640:254-3241(+)